VGGGIWFLGVRVFCHAFPHWEKVDAEKKVDVEEWRLEVKRLEEKR
jgi:hypothetical protein